MASWTVVSGHIELTGRMLREIEPTLLSVQKDLLAGIASGGDMSNYSGEDLCCLNFVSEKK